MIKRVHLNMERRTYWGLALNQFKSCFSFLVFNQLLFWTCKPDPVHPKATTLCRLQQRLQKLILNIVYSRLFCFHMTQCLLLISKFQARSGIYIWNSLKSKLFIFIVYRFLLHLNFFKEVYDPMLIFDVPKLLLKILNSK